MTTATLRPNATVVAGGGLVGAATEHAATSDNSDGSYVTTSFGEYGLSTITFPAGAVMRQVRVRWRGRYNSIQAGEIPGPASISLRSGGSTLASHSTTPTGTTTTYTGAFSQVSLAAVGGVTTQAQIDALTMRVTSSGLQAGADGRVRAHELYADLLYVLAPVAVVTPVAPDPFEASSFVPVSWTPTLDPDGGVQTRYQVKVFRATDTVALGFSPGSSTALFDSGVTVSAGQSRTVGPLPNDDLVVYVRVGQDVNGAAHWSAWASDEFTVDVATADIDTITATPVNAAGKVTVTVDRDAASEPWEFIEVQRSIDGGTTWTDVRSATYVDATGDPDEFVVDDHEVGNGVTVRYRARATWIDNGLQVVGQWLASSPVTWSSDDVWVKDPIAPSRNMKVCLRSAPATVRMARRGVFVVVGRALPVVVSDVMSAVTTSFEVRGNTIAESLQLEALMSTTPVLLFQVPATMPDGSRYLSPGAVERSAFEPEQPRPKQWIAVLDAVETSGPADSSAGR